MYQFRAGAFHMCAAFHIDNMVKSRFVFFLRLLCSVTSIKPVRSVSQPPTSHVSSENT